MKRVAAITAGLLLTGCSAIPSSGPVVQGPRIDVVGSGGYVRVIARPPSPGMSPEALVRGFLDACASLTDGDETARLYLTPGAAQQWNPLERTEVYDAAALTLVSERDDRVRIDAPLIGSVDSTRRYAVGAVGARIVDSLRLEQLDGEWRIASPPAALYLGEGDIARSFRVHPVYFLDQAEQRVVPEYVVLPIGAASPESLLLRALLDGPSAAAGPSLHSAAPVGTALGSGGVSIDAGIATVHLVGPSIGTNSVERRAFIAQMTWTLTRLPNVATVLVLLNGEPVPLAGRGTLISLLDVASFDPAPEATPPSLVFLQSDRVLVSRAGTRTVLAKGRAYAAFADTRTGLVRLAVEESRKILFASVSGAAMRAIALGNDLAAPSILPDGEAWFVDREARGGLFTWRVGSRPTVVKTGLPTRARILDYAVAPDGSRIALVVNDGATNTLRVGLIVRTEGKVEVTGLARVEQRLASVSAVAWQSESELAVLGSVGTVPAQPVTVTLPLGGVTNLGGPANVVSITAAPGAPIVVGDQAGQLWEYSASRWTASDLGAAPHYVL